MPGIVTAIFIADMEAFMKTLTNMYFPPSGILHIIHALCSWQPLFAVSNSWWYHAVETLSALLAVSPHKSPIMQTSDIFFVVKLSKLLKE